MSIQGFSDWLAATPASQAIQAAFWVVPTVQSVHILAIALLAGSALMIDLRLIGLIGRDRPFPDFQRRYLPWLFAAFVVLLATGATMIVGEPDRTLMNWVFWTKVGLILASVALTAAIGGAGGYLERRRGLAILVGLLSLVLWALVIICGRWIAYVL